MDQAFRKFLSSSREAHAALQEGLLNFEVHVPRPRLGETAKQVILLFGEFCRHVFSTRLMTN